MKVNTFFQQLAITSGIIALMLAGLHQFAGMASVAHFSWSCWLFFIVFSILVYGFGFQSARSANRHAFTTTTVGFVFFKMILSVAFVVIYAKMYTFTDNLFLISFFIIYLAYTIFETHVMIKLGKLRPRRP